MDFTWIPDLNIVTYIEYLFAFLLTANETVVLFGNMHCIGIIIGQFTKLNLNVCSN